MKKNVDFSIVFPVMNQEDHIGKVIRTYHRELTRRGFSFELIAVVNGSNDRSYKICREVSKKLPDVKSYMLSDSGYGLGILQGLKKSQGKYLCYLNCARIHTPDLLRMLRHFQIDDGVIVHGVRMSRENEKRRIGSLFYNIFWRIVFRLSNRDINGNPNLFSRKTYEKLKLRFTDSMIDPELLEKAKLMRIPVVEVPVIDYTRYGGRSTSTWQTIFRLMRETANYWLKTRVFS